MTTTEEKESFGKRLYKAIMKPTVTQAVIAGGWGVMSLIITESIIFCLNPSLLEIFPKSGYPILELYALLALSIILFGHYSKLAFRLNRKVKAWEKRDEEEGRA